LKRICKILILETLVFTVSVALKAIEEEEKKNRLYRRGLS
jgi:hypothetical protein